MGASFGMWILVSGRTIGTEEKLKVQDNVKIQSFLNDVDNLD